MGIFDRLFGKKAAVSAPADHAVIVQFRYGSTDFAPVFALGDRLEEAIVAARVGEYDGNEVATDGSDGSLYMYGPDAARLFEVVRPVLMAAPFMGGAKVRLRFGPAGSSAREEQVVLGH